MDEQEARHEGRAGGRFGPPPPAGRDTEAIGL